MAESRGNVFAHWPNRITAHALRGRAGAVRALRGPRRALPWPRSGARWILFAFVLFVVVAATDFLDGWLARRDGTW